MYSENKYVQKYNKYVEIDSKYQYKCLINDINVVCGFCLCLYDICNFVLVSKFRSEMKFYVLKVALSHLKHIT
jgi:hypothetical protein